jgi:uncharacterized protein (DUF2235 family)
MKRIIICCDGTWNTPDKSTSGIPLHTNLVKIAQAIKPVSDFGVRQLTYYNVGIGTSGTFLKKWYDGATGSGISKNIIEAYNYLILNYDLNDELFFFGFSRGAFTVRSLAGLIRNSGILRKDSIDMVDRAYKLYKSRSKSSHPKQKEATLFRKTYAVADKVPIKFIGVWDTVGSLGNPLVINTIFSAISPVTLSNRFHDAELSSIVQNAFHAIAIDEKRRSFEPTIWIKQIDSLNQHVDQRWFIGAHSNIGGGYPSTALSDIALEWMIEKAKSCKLDIDPPEIAPNHLKSPDESWKGFYKLIPRLNRPIGKAKNSFEELHSSVNKRYDEDPDYRPKNLVDYKRQF